MSAPVAAAPSSKPAMIATTTPMAGLCRTKSIARLHNADLSSIPCAMKNTSPGSIICLGEVLDDLDLK